MHATSTPTIVVTGATGQQGGAVVKSLRRSFHVKAITRDPKKPEAQALTKLGVEVVAADLLDRASLERAFAGAHGVFALTNFWDGMASGKPLGAEGQAPACRVEFDLRYAFSSTAFEAVLSPVFDRVANTFIDSFVQRAEQVYGER